jgi:thiamine biosynthesis lipoprotein
MHRVTKILVTTWLLAAAVLCAQDRVKLYATDHPAMGTTFTLYLYSADPKNAAAVAEEVFDQIDETEQELSNYRETSELSRIDNEAAKGPVTTDPETFDFLVQSVYWSKVSGGAFDITVGRLMKAWGFFRKQGHVPTDTELGQLRAVTGWKKIVLDPSTRTVRFTAPGVELDPGGIGKGFAVDAAVRVLRRDHVAAALLSAGSSTIYALGAPPHSSGWKIVIPGPLPGKGELTSVTLRDTSLSSADCSQKNFTADGHFYCHIMDPRMMRPVEGRVQVSIVDPSATASDALSNVLFVETPKQSLATLRTFAPRSRAIIVSDGSGKPVCTTFRWIGSLTRQRCVAGVR